MYVLDEFLVRSIVLVWISAQWSGIYEKDDEFEVVTHVVTDYLLSYFDSFN